jgi:hypothetical protein
MRFRNIVFTAVGFPWTQFLAARSWFRISLRLRSIRRSC